MADELTIHTVENARSPYAEEFITLPHQIFRTNPYWVPWFRQDMRSILERNHPFFEHSEGEFFIARRGGRVVARIAALENKNFNAYQGRRDARFYFFDTKNDPEAAGALFQRVEEWAHQRRLSRVIGPQGFSGMTGAGILIDGYQTRAAMTMMNYHLPYYRDMVESYGFEKYKDFVSAYLDAVAYETPAKIRRVAEISLRRGSFRIPEMKTRRELRALGREIGRIYNESWVDHEEYCPMTEGELTQLVDSLVTVSDPRLIKVIRAGDEIAGFLLTFPDLSPAIQASGGRVTPLSLARLLYQKRKTREFIINGVGVLPKFQKTGATALLYYELERTLKGRALRAEMTQIAETTDLMLSDMETLGGEVYKRHRVYQLEV
ncbi:MAG: hypothetical protein ACLFP6_00175 [Spirochaetaceae bacterium]